VEYFVEKVEGFFFIGLPLRTADKKEEELAIAQHWERFFEEEILKKIPKRIDEQILGLYTEYEEKTGSYTFLIGCIVEKDAKAPEELISLYVPEANYAVFTVKGAFPYSLIDVGESIENSPLKRGYTTDFEVYGRGFQNNPPNIDVYIAIEEVPLSR
jgi:predicted transcriptional regulator YdeE